MLVLFLHLFEHPVPDAPLPRIRAPDDAAASLSLSPLAQALVAMPPLVRLRAALDAPPVFTSARCVFPDPDVRDDDDVQLVSSNVSAQQSLWRAVDPATATLILEGSGAVTEDATAQTVADGPLRHCSVHVPERPASSRAAEWTRLLDAVRASMHTLAPSRLAPPPLDELASVAPDTASAAQSRAAYFRKALEFYAYSRGAQTPSVAGVPSRLFTAAAGSCMVALADRTVLVQLPAGAQLPVSLLHLLHAFAVRGDMRACAQLFATATRSHRVAAAPARLLCFPKQLRARQPAASAASEYVASSAVPDHRTLRRYLVALHSLACNALGISDDVPSLAQVLECVVSLTQQLERKGRHNEVQA